MLLGRAVARFRAGLWHGFAPVLWHGLLTVPPFADRRSPEVPATGNRDLFSDGCN
jgi:hypothetical protein